MRIRGAGITCAVLALLAAAACGGGVPEEAGDGGGSGGGGSLSVAAVWTGPEQESFQAVLDAFTENTGIQTEFKSTGDDISTYLGSQVAGGNPPDVAILPQPGLLQALVEQGNLKPLGEQPIANLEENFPQYWVDLASSGGDTYGVYFKAANKSTWWYNTQAFESAGVQPPQSWDEMLGQAETVAASGLPYTSIGGSDGWVLTDWFENIYLRQAGPKMYDRLTNHTIPWTHESVTQALVTFRELLRTPGAVKDGPQGAVETSFTDSVDQVLTGEPAAATVMEADFVPGTASDSDLQAGTDYAFFDFPTVDGSGPAVVGGGDVAVTLTGSDQAQQLLAFLATPEAAAIWAERGGFTSPNQNLDLSTYPDEVSRKSAQAVTQASEAGSFRFDLSDQTPPAFGGTEGRGLWKHLQTFLQNPEDVAGVQQKLEADAKAAYSGGE